MDTAARGFAGLVVVIALTYIVISMERQQDREQELILNNNPKEVAKTAFRDNEIIFYEVWFEWYHPEGRVDRRWRLPGEKQIPPAILANHTGRHQLQSTQNPGLDPEHVQFNRQARRWAGIYNSHLAELLVDGAPRF